MEYQPIPLVDKQNSKRPNIFCFGAMIDNIYIDEVLLPEESDENKKQLSKSKKELVLNDEKTINISSVSRRIASGRTFAKQKSNCAENIISTIANGLQLSREKDIDKIIARATGNNISDTINENLSRSCRVGFPFMTSWKDSNRTHFLDEVTKITESSSNQKENMFPAYQN